MRGATFGTVAAIDAIKFQSTLPMRGATQVLGQDFYARCISIHAPHAGSDPYCSKIGAMVWEFQSTLPMRGATMQFTAVVTSFEISIHAPHAGSDIHRLDSH